MDQPGNHILLRGNQPGAADRMRELLARTVQDHVADQRSTGGSSGSINDWPTLTTSWARSTPG